MREHAAAAAASPAGRAGARAAIGPGYGRGRRYLLFALPALVVIAAVVVFPWLFTLYMSVFEWKVAATPRFVGLGNYLGLASDARFLLAFARTLYYAALAVAAPLVLGLLSALVFHRQFAGRAVLRSIFVMPMMATPVAVALVWTMMFHPQLGVLNYLLSLVGIPPQSWVYDQDTVIPSLVLVETWQWTPLVMLIVLGGLASLPTEPYESAEIDGASPWQMFRRITLPMIMPFLIVAAILRSIDALKSFDIIFVITQGGPGTASETLNIYLYLQAFSFYNIGYASAVVVIFFVLIIALSLVLLWLRQRSAWTG